DRGIKIEFYDVVASHKGLKYVIDFDIKVDLFFANSYFGYESTSMDSIIDVFNKRNITVIEDITHRLLSDKNYCEQADYFIASLRKWFAIPSGGLAIKNNGKFNNIHLSHPSSDLLNKKITAMKCKST